MVFFCENMLFGPLSLCFLLTMIYSSTIQCWIRTCYNNLFQPRRGGEATSGPPATSLQVALGFPRTLCPYCSWTELVFVIRC